MKLKLSVATCFCIMISGCATLPNDSKGKAIAIIGVDRKNTFNVEKAADKASMGYFRNYKLYFHNKNEPQNRKHYFQIKQSSLYVLFDDLLPGEYEIYEIEPYVSGNNKTLKGIPVSITFECNPGTITILDKVLNIEVYKQDNGYPNQRQEVTELSEDKRESIITDLKSKKNIEYWSY